MKGLKRSLAAIALLAALSAAAIFMGTGSSPALAIVVVCAIFSVGGALAVFAVVESVHRIRNFAAKTDWAAAPGKIGEVSGQAFEKSGASLGAIASGFSKGREAERQRSGKAEA